MHKYVKASLTLLTAATALTTLVAPALATMGGFSPRIQALSPGLREGDGSSLGANTGGWSASSKYAASRLCQCGNSFVGGGYYTSNQRNFVSIIGLSNNRVTGFIDPLSGASLGQNQSPPYTTSMGGFSFSYGHPSYGKP